MKPMAPLLSSRYLVCLYLIVLFLFNSSKHSFGFEARKIAASRHLQHFHTVQISSLLPSSSCKLSTKAHDKRTTIEVVHKYGPCRTSHNNQGKPHTTKTGPSHEQILEADQSRVKSIHSKLSKALQTGSDDSQLKVTDATNLPAKDGSTIGSGNYIVTVGLGTPKKELSLIFDTGSDITWTQCEPCVKYCYDQKEDIFDPVKSASYTNISCSSTLCASLSSATGNSLNCASSTCLYGIQYGDSSYSVGFFAREKLSLTSADSFDNVYFGCGQNNRGLFGGAAGLLGLGRDKLSFPSQTASKYNKLFSYCLPSTSSSTGFLSFGGPPPKPAKFTPLSSVSASTSFYGLDFTGIIIGGKKLSIPTSVFTTADAIIDSGTVITRLPPAAYTQLRSEFRQLMSKYPTASSLSILDTCYDFSNYKTVTFPKIAVEFIGGIMVEIDGSGVFYVASVSQVCLAFAGNGDPSDVGIFGNTQQKTFEVVYDGAGGRVGFAPGGCT